jgi:hypothetical protein
VSNVCGAPRAMIMAGKSMAYAMRRMEQVEECMPRELKSLNPHNIVPQIVNEISPEIMVGNKTTTQDPKCVV